MDKLSDILSEYGYEISYWFDNVPPWRGDRNYFNQGVSLGHELGYWEAEHKYINIYEPYMSELEAKTLIIKCLTDDCDDKCMVCRQELYA